MAAFRDAPIRRKLIAISAVAAAAGLLLAALALTAYAVKNQLDAIEGTVTSVARVIALNSTAALAFSDADSAKETLSAVRALDVAQAACLYALPGGALFASFPGQAEAQCPPAADQLTRHRSLTQLQVVTPVELDGEGLGRLWVNASLAPMWQQVAGQSLIFLLVLVTSLLATVAVVSRLQGIISRPIVNLAGVARHVRDTRDYTQRAEKTSDDETGQLVDDFNAMLQRIETASRETESANAELHAAMAQLQDTQTQLVQTEKMASLGGLVAGVAHEINTPVGIGVTAASTLQARTTELRRLYAEGSMKRSDLDQFMDFSEQSADIIMSNLRRAADLVQSFKQVAVDQSSSERRVFELKAYIDEVLTSLRPRLKKSAHDVQVDIPEQLLVDSYPGAMAQIITNLVTNALLHAFDDGEVGVLRISAQMQGDDVLLDFSDNGKGIPVADQAKIFDPFFTTKRGSGGSGLGMHIVYNLVTQMLGGTVKLVSQLGEGTEFKFRFPAKARTGGGDHG